MLLLVGRSKNISLFQFLLALCIQLSGWENCPSYPAGCFAAAHDSSCCIPPALPPPLILLGSAQGQRQSSCIVCQVVGRIVPTAPHLSCPCADRPWLGQGVQIQCLYNFSSCQHSIAVQWLAALFFWD